MFSKHAKNWCISRIQKRSVASTIVGVVFSDKIAKVEAAEFESTTFASFVKIYTNWKSLTLVFLLSFSDFTLDILLKKVFT